MCAQLLKPLRYCLNPISFIISFHVLLINFPTCLAQFTNFNYYSDCSNTTVIRCGDTIFNNPLYPFWGKSFRPAYCGLDGFELHCDNNDLVVDIGSRSKYHVVAINSVRGVLTLNRSDDPLGSICASGEATSTVFNATLYDYTDYTEDLNLFYNCDDEIDSVWLDYTFTCKGDSKKRVYFFRGNSFELVEDNKLESCTNTTIQVDKRVFDDLKNNRIEAETLFNRSFEVHYNRINEILCSDCQATEGLCWRGTNTSHNTCLYSNGTALPPYGYGRPVFIPRHNAKVDLDMYNNCSKPTTSPCGTPLGWGVDYPFWVEQDIRPSYCGLEGYKLSCEDNGLVVDLALDIKYNVLEINPFTITIESKPLGNPLKSICEPSSSSNQDTEHNDLMFYSLENSEVIYVFYNCSDHAQTTSIKANFSCWNDNRDPVYFFRNDLFVQAQKKLSSCNYTRLPVKMRLLEEFKSDRNPAQQTAEKLFEGSFEVYYNKEGNQQVCKDCYEHDNGVCWKDTYVGSKDPCLYPRQSEENELVRKMVMVGLWCIQIYPSQRPSISKVIEMLEGQTAALEIPPRPYLCSVPGSPSNSPEKPVFCSSSGTEPTLSA
ncbi:hypothetical protein ACET3Z_014267 [Daucus carota]